MKQTLLLLLSVITLTFVGCNKAEHLIKNESKRQITLDAYNVKSKLFDSTIFAIVNNKSLTLEEVEALKFLYAYAPLTDLTFEPQSYLDAVRVTLEAKNSMPWAKDLNEDIFLHFVLPLRVNNENLDSARVVFYNELKDRVKNMTLKDAALEVNHWCHENVIYTPSDSRTSSPLASIRTAHGRCGEESVLTVAALRSVGIPARQVYTPRWAHSDDNHAWVEVWGGDKWYYLGACEPEPRLDMGWFTAPSMRGMLMHTKVYGDYNGKEEIMMKTPLFTEINVTENYAEVKKVEITVVDETGLPVKDADIEVKIYNYAVFTTVANKVSDESGKTTISLGLGDVLVWATKNGKSGFTKVSAKDSDRATVTISENMNTETVELDIVPPVEKQPVVVVTDEERYANTVRLQAEDSIRNSYTATFMSESAAAALANNLSLDAAKVSNYIVASRGNHDEIVKYLKTASENKYPTTLDMLKVISEKDLRDIKADILLSHTKSALEHKDKYNQDIFNSYLLNPRVANEMVDSYREPLKAHYGNSLDIKQIIEIAANLRIDDMLNSAVAPVRPLTVMALNMANISSRDIFFVALARSYGIPARLEPATSKVQYYENGEWFDVSFETLSQSQSKQGTISFSYKPIKTVSDPKYGTHFSLSRITENGNTVSIKMPSNESVDMGGGSSLKETFTVKRAIDVGRYMLTSGTRLANGSVLSRLLFFDVIEGQNSDIELKLRENDQDIFVIGSIDPEARVTPVGQSEVKSILDITGRGYFMLALIGPAQEPTNHAMRSMVALNSVLTAWGRPIVIVFKTDSDVAKAAHEPWGNSVVATAPENKSFGELPSINYVIDSNDKVQEMLNNLKLDTNNQLPIFIIADTFGRVVFTSAGYQINLADNIQNVITKL